MPKLAEMESDPTIAKMYILMEMITPTIVENTLGELTPHFTSILGTTIQKTSSKGLLAYLKVLYLKTDKEWQIRDF